MSKSRSGDLKISENDAGPPLSPLPHGVPRSAIGWRIVLAIVMALYVCIASIHAFRAPVGATGYQDAPDEEAHVTVIRVMAAGRMPTKDHPGLSPSDARPSYEWHQPPLYYFIAARLLPAGVKGIRLLSILIGAAGILTIYRACRVLLPERPETAVLAAGFAALTPGHIAISSVVNNDGLLELCFSGYLFMLFVTLVRGLTLRRSILLGAILGAALLTKLTAVLLLPLTLLGLALLWRNGERRGDVVRSALVIAGTALVLCGWWFARNGMLYHEVLPLTAFSESFQGTAKAADVVAGRLVPGVEGWPDYASLVARWTFQSFFAVYSTVRGSAVGLPSFLPDQLYQLALVVVAASVAGLVLLYVRHRSEFARSQVFGFWLASAMIALVAGSFVLFTARYFQTQGRYFYPALLPITLLGALGWQALFPARYKTVASMLLLGFLGVFCLVFLQATG